MLFVGRTVACAAAGLWIDSVFAATCARLTPTEILRSVYGRLERKSISHDGLLLDYVGEIPTAAEITDLKPGVFQFSRTPSRCDDRGDFALVTDAAYAPTAGTIPICVGPNRNPVG